MASEHAKFYETISLLSKEQLELLFRTATTKISEKMFLLKNNTANISSLLEYNCHTDGQGQLNSNFEDIEMIEYNIDEFFEKYKLIKKTIASARLIKLKLCECDLKEDVPDDLAKIGCKKIQIYQ